MKCQLEKQLNRYYDDELEPLQKAEFKKHLDSCLFCKDWIAEQLQLDNLIKKSSELVAAPSEMLQEILNSVQTQNEITKIGMFRAQMKTFSKLAIAACVIFAFWIGTFSFDYINQATEANSLMQRETLYSFLQEK